MTVHVLENDSDLDNDPLTIREAIDAGSSGSVVIGPEDTTLTFTPEPGFTGDVVFGGRGNGIYTERLRTFSESSESL